MVEMLKGIAASDGVAVAKAYLLVQPDLSFSKVNVEDGNEIIVKRHPGEKCERCWSYHNHLVDVNGSKVCSRCEKVLKDGKFF